MHNNKIYTFHFTNVIFEREKKKKIPRHFRNKNQIEFKFSQTIPTPIQDNQKSVY